MKTFLTFLITEIISREPEVMDYVFVYEMLTLYEEEMREVKPKIKKIIQEEHKLLVENNIILKQILAYTNLD